MHVEVLALTLSQPQHKPPYLPNRGNFTLFTLSQPGKIHSYHIKRLYCLSPSLSPSSAVAVIRSDSKQFDIIKVIFGSFGGNISHVGASPLQGDRIGKKNARIAGFFSTSIIFRLLKRWNTFLQMSQTFVFPSVPSEQTEQLRRIFRRIFFLNIPLILLDFMLLCFVILKKMAENAGRIAWKLQRAGVLHRHALFQPPCD